MHKMESMSTLNHAHIYIYRYMSCNSTRPADVDSLQLGWRCTGGGQNNGNTKKLRNRFICVDFIERTSVGSTECFCICLHSVVLLSVN
jgi:hypothetical protein